MEIKRAIKKIIALGTGATMVGATVLGAMAAANLANYPAPFVTEDHQWDAVSIIGATSTAEDNVAITDIVLGLKTYEIGTTTGTSATTTLVGDAYQITKSSDPLNLYEYLNSGSGAASTPLENGPISRVTSSELNALADGMISNAKGTFTYDQRIVMPDNATVTYAVDDDQSDDPAFYLKFVDSTVAYEYRLTFGSALKSDIDDDGNFDDLDNKKITMLGKEYTIINTDSTTGGNTLELMGGTIPGCVLSEGESKVYSIDGVDYEVEVMQITDFSSDNKVKFIVNGDPIEAMMEGDSLPIATGVELGVREIWPNEAGDVGSDNVEFYLGAQKIVFKDDTIDSTENWDGTVTVGSTDLDVEADIVGSFLSSGTDVSISKIRVKWTTDDDYYVPVEGKLSDRLDADYKGNLFLENLDFEFTGVNVGDTEEIKLSNSGDDEMKVTIPTLSGGDLTLYAFYSTSGGPAIGLGKDADHQLIIDADLGIYKNYQFIIDDNAKSSHLIKVKNFKDTTTEDKVTFEDVGLGNTWDVTTNATGYGTFDIDGVEYSFETNYTEEFINMSSLSAGIIWTASEAKVTLSTDTSNENGIMVFTEYDGGTGDNSTVKRTVTAIVKDPAGTTDDIEVTSVVDDDPYSPALQNWESNDDLSDTYTRWGTHVEYNSPSSGQAYVTITYPVEEATADVYVASGVTTTSTTSAGEGGMTYGVIEIPSVMRDIEVADWKETNVIVVGGPCINSVASDLMGGGLYQVFPDCSQDFEEGKAKIKLFEVEDKVALLVAGMTGADTKRAGLVLKNYKDYAADLVGTEVEMTATTDLDIELAAPVPVVEEAAE